MAQGTDEAAARRQQLVLALERVATGDRDALRQVYEMTSAKLLGIIVRILPDREQAEDVLQDVYFKVWRRAGRYDASLGSPISWLAVIARNAAVDEARRNGRTPASEDGELENIVDDAQLPDDFLCEAEMHAEVRRCLDELEENQRRSIRMAFFGGLTHSQLAEALAVPLGTMKSWIRRGLANLKGCLGHGTA
ncbi:sigma-70 family RNA polymerase sigma factor [Novosphingobium marinum]|uniref:RNA polymerase sigma-70 factor (ECF subfamily) n=1 Tax=Novosphingobium marinum TaxID=1514948 RepID=A0A7Y9Y068_9SPHN|nr:sigma-70 family RNA polymerase sigma factor [Novosphingobium marinum]NYH96570.1 RNA polymerase sigma-70 factor (ECF subfamily) [Novosphingobium marinum]